MRRALRITGKVVILLAVAAVAAAAAPAAGNAPVSIPGGVSAGGVPLAGLTWSPARQVLADSLERPLHFALDKQAWTISPERFHAYGDVDGAVAGALRARAGAEVPLQVTFARERINSYVAAIASELDRPSQDARIDGLAGLRPVIVSERRGRALNRKALVEAIEHALVTNDRSVIELTLRPLEPEVRAADLPPVIVIQRESKRLHLYVQGTHVRSFPIATGKPEYPTPLGRFSIVDMQRNPWWRPPPSDWAKGLRPVPPGPGNPLGTRWMGFDRYMVGIHGTSNAASIGTPASHGCVRMYTQDAEWLFDRITWGTQVFVLAA